MATETRKIIDITSSSKAEKFFPRTIDTAVYHNNADGTTINVKDAIDSKQDKLTFDTTPTSGSSRPVTSDGIKSALNGKANSSHTHTIANVTGLQSALDGKANVSHTHQISNITNLQSSLDDKANVVHGHKISDVTGLQSALDGKQAKLTFDSTPTANSSNPVTSAGIKTALDGKQNTLTFDSAPKASSTNPVTSGGIKTALDGKANTSHTHTIANVTGLQSALDGKQAKLTFDSTPTANSSNPVTSGGAYTELAKKLNVAGDNGTEAGVSALVNTLGLGDSDPQDADYYVAQYAGGGTTYRSYYRRPHFRLWNYIKGKISSVLGLTASAYSGKASTAGNADKATNDARGQKIDTTYIKEISASGKTLTIERGDGTTTTVTTQDTITTIDSALSATSTNPVQNKVVKAALDSKQNTLTFDSTPTADSSNPVTSKGIKTALDGKANSSHTHTIANVSGLQSALDGKQAKLTFDSTPTANSSNPVTSGGVKTALDGKANTSHTHTIANVSGLQSALDGKASTSSVSAKVSKSGDTMTGTLTVPTLKVTPSSSITYDTSTATLRIVT